MEQSILKSVKASVGVTSDDPSFDIDIINAINAEFSILSDIGVGPETGFVIEDETIEWSAFIDVDGDEAKRVWLSKVKMAVNLRTRLLFDPPAQSFHVTALEKQLLEQEWRLSVNRENVEYTNPFPPTDPPLEDIFEIDGGGSD